MNTAIMLKNVAGGVIDKPAAAHASALVMNAENGHPSRLSFHSHDREISRSPVARRVKSVMVAAALMMSAQGAYASNNAAEAAAINNAAQSERH